MAQARWTFLNTLPLQNNGVQIENDCSEPLQTLHWMKRANVPERECEETSARLLCYEFFTNGQKESTIELLFRTKVLFIQQQPIITEL
jgi:hypothetical protein